MDPEMAAMKKIKTLVECISPLDENDKPTDFFFRYKNIARMIIEYLDVIDLHLLSQVNKFFFFEIHEKPYFRTQFFRLLADSILVIPKSSDHKDYKKLGAIVYIKKSPAMAVLSSLRREEFLATSYGPELLEKAEGSKILLPHGKHIACNLFNGTGTHIIGLEHANPEKAEKDEDGELKKGAVISGPMVIDVEIKFENVRFEVISPNPKTMDNNVIISEFYAPTYENCQFVGNTHAFLMSNSGINLINCSVTNPSGMGVVFFESSSKNLIQEVRFYKCRSGLNCSDSSNVLVQGCVFNECGTGLEWYDNKNSTSKSIELTNSKFFNCGEALFLKGGKVKATNNEFVKNKVGVVKKISGLCTFTDNLFKENEIGFKIKLSLEGIEKDNKFESNGTDVLNSQMDLGTEAMNKYKDIDPELVEILEKQICTYAETKNHYSAQEGWYCDTCNLGEFTMICVPCIRKCHAGHNVRFEKISEGFCDCAELPTCCFKEHF